MDSVCVVVRDGLLVAPESVNDEDVDNDAVGPVLVRVAVLVVAGVIERERDGVPLMLGVPYDGVCDGVPLMLRVPYDGVRDAVIVFVFVPAPALSVVSVKRMSNTARRTGTSQWIGLFMGEFWAVGTDTVLYTVLQQRTRATSSCLSHVARRGLSVTLTQLVGSEPTYSLART
jgi:hypothetical protein